MNIFTDLLFIYVYVAVLIFLGFINFESDNYLSQKLYLFVSLVMFNSLLEIMKNFKSKCKTSGCRLINNSVKVGTVGVLGLMVYTDLMFMGWSRHTFESINASRFNRSLLIPLVVVFAIMVIKLIYVMFDVDERGCDDDNHDKKD